MVVGRGWSYASRLIVILYSNFQIFFTVGWHKTNFICTVNTFADHEYLLFGQKSTMYLLYMPSYGKLSGKKIQNFLYLSKILGHQGSLRKFDGFTPKWGAKYKGA